MIIFILLLLPVLAVAGLVAIGIHIARNIARIQDPAQRAQARDHVLLATSALYFATRYPEATAVAAGAGIGSYMGTRAAQQGQPQVTYNVGPVYVVNVEHWGEAPSTPYPGQWRL